MCILVKPNVQLIDVNAEKMLCNVWICASVQTARNDNAHDSSDDELEYIATNEEENSQYKTLEFQTSCFIWFSLVYNDIVIKMFYKFL